MTCRNFVKFLGIEEQFVEHGTSRLIIRFNPHIFSEVIMSLSDEQKWVKGTEFGFALMCTLQEYPEEQVYFISKYITVWVSILTKSNVLVL